jgi:6-phosphogluconate dehydrogenase
MDSGSGAGMTLRLRYRLNLTPIGFMPLKIKISGTGEKIMKITLIGTGLMGYPMAKKLINAGYDLTAFNRTFEKAAPLADFGANVVTTPQEAIHVSECIILMLKDANAINEILLQILKYFQAGQ